MPESLAVPSSRKLSRRRFLGLASAGLALAALVAPWRRLLPGDRRRDLGRVRFPPGSLFAPRTKR